LAVDVTLIRLHRHAGDAANKSRRRSQKPRTPRAAQFIGRTYHRDFFALKSLFTTPPTPSL